MPKQRFQQSEFLNPLEALPRDSQAVLLEAIFKHPTVVWAAKKRGLLMYEITGELYERLVECRPRKEVTNTGGWLFRNTLGYIRQIADQESKRKLKSMENAKDE